MSGPGISATRQGGSPLAVLAGPGGANVVISGDTSLTADVYCNNFTVLPGVTLTWLGTWRIFARGKVLIAGTINANGQGQPAGVPGIGCGGAGGKGGAGRDNTGGDPGAVSGAANLSPLDALTWSYLPGLGGGGGAGSDDTDIGEVGGPGGAGGGSVRIVAGEIVVTGSITARGIDGTSIAAPSLPWSLGGGGGGGGGLVYLAHGGAPIDPARIDVSGGLGGGGHIYFGGPVMHPDEAGADGGAGRFVEVLG